jgi:hypothetical protein
MKRHDKEALAQLSVIWKIGLADVDLKMRATRWVHAVYRLFASQFL